MEGDTVRMLDIDRKTAKDSSLRNDRAPALTEGLRILELVGDSPEGVSFETILRSVRMSRSSVNRLLKNLANSGYLRVQPRARGLYHPGLRLFSLAYQVNANHKTMEAIHNSLQNLALETGTSTQYAIFDRTIGRIIVLDKAETPGSIHLVGAGTDLTPFANRHGLGKVILAHCTPQEKSTILARVDPEKKTPQTVVPGPALDELLDEVRHLGYAVDREESDLSQFRVAVGVFDANGSILGSVCCTWHGQRDPERATFARQRIAELARGLSGLSITR